MLQTDNSIRGKVMRELIARVASDNLIGRKLKSGELRKKMTEPEWRVPEFYNLRVIEEKNCRLELLECDIKNEAPGAASAARRRIYRGNAQCVPQFCGTLQ